MIHARGDMRATLAADSNGTAGLEKGRGQARFARGRDVKEALLGEERQLLSSIVRGSLHCRAKKNRLRGRQLVSRPSVALQMKTLNNLVAGCKSRREATLIDTRRCVPLRYTARQHL